MRFRRGLAAVVTTSTVLLNGCVTTTQNNNFNSTLWVQTASEYKANSIQTYNAAKQVLDLSLSDSSWTAALEQSGDYSMLPVAVVMDIDETVLDNSKYQAQLVKDGSEYSSVTWDKWVSLKSAPAIPGAVDFIKAMRAKNVEVIYITDRECKPREGKDSKCPQEQDTIDNLIKEGIEGTKPENILLKKEQPEWSSEKKNRREYVAAKYRVLMLFGDNLGDFLPNVKKNITSKQRDELVQQNSVNWGRKWYMLSNPTYGSWLHILEESKSKHLVGY